MLGRHRQGIALALILGLALGGCAGVSDESDDASTALDVAYDGNTAPADIELANADEIGAAAFHVAEDLDRLVELLSQSNPSINGAAARPLLSITIACDDGGSRTLTSNADVVTAEFLDCTTDGVTVNGTAERTGGDAAWMLTISAIHIVNDEYDLSVAGTASYVDDGDTEALTLHDIVVTDNTSAYSLASDDLVLIRTHITNGELLSIDGALMHSTHGQVGVDTDDNDPLFFASGDRYPSAGLLRLTGQGNESLIVMPLNASQLNVRVDADGNGSFERDETLNWRDFAERVAPHD